VGEDCRVEVSSTASRAVRSGDAGMQAAGWSPQRLKARCSAKSQRDEDQKTMSTG